jgi:hypothetical protein
VDRGDLVSEDNRIPEEDREERPAAIARAHAALGGPALTTDAELRALTPDQLEKCVHRALEAHDVEAVEGYLLLMALKDPHRAADIVETLKIGVRLAKETRPAPHARPAVADSTDRPAVGVAATRLVQDHHPDGVNPDNYETCECGWTASDENERWADHLVHVLAVDGLLAEPGLCDGCDRTDAPVKASDDGRAQFCPTCLPQANHDYHRDEDDGQ